MTDVATVIDQYIAMWNETDEQRRRKIIAQTWTEDATYLDPHFSGDGPDGINTMVTSVQTQFPGYRFRLVGSPDAHHECVRFGWHLVGPDSDGPVAVGVDFGTLAGDGRLHTVTGFLEPAA